MSGLRKAKKYDWKDSNLALFGSDTEKNVKKESAMTEKAWKGAGQKPGLKIWRIVQFEVKDWPREDYGKFFNGDSYIILNTYKKENSKSDELLYDVHFWIGEESTQDEYGTAAYKTVELDTFLDDKPVQHREVQKHESALFKSYFKTITILQGGAESGFKHVTYEQYKPRLLHVSGNKGNVVVTEVVWETGSLKDGDVFIFDLGEKVIKWFGKDCSKDEKFKATQYVQEMTSERGGKPFVVTLDYQSVDNLDELYETGISLPRSSEGQALPDQQPDTGPKVKHLFKLSDASGQMVWEEVAVGDAVKQCPLRSDDVFILDTGDHCFVRNGRRVSIDERRNGMTYAHTYLQKTSHPLLPISVIEEGKEPEGFLKEVKKSKFS